MSKYLAAVVQGSSFPDDPMLTAEKAARLLRDAFSRGARLAVVPEAFLGGYPKGASFGSPFGVRKPEGREAYRRYYEAAIDLDGPEVRLIAEATAETGLFAVIGCIERDGGTLYCTALFFDGAQGLIGKHRKLMPTASERREAPYRIYDLHQRGLSLQILPTGQKTWKCIYSLRGRRRWFTIGSIHAVGLADARMKAGAHIASEVKPGRPVNLAGLMPRTCSHCDILVSTQIAYRDAVVDRGIE